MENAKYWRENLKLEKHPEGGWFKQVYRSEEKIKKEHLPERYSGARHHGTSIYFLITDKEFSAFHRIKSDEIWHFYEGCGVTIHVIEEAGNYSTVKLGNNFEAGEVFQYTIPHGTWFAGTVDEADSLTVGDNTNSGKTIDEVESFALISCSVSPGFDYDDFELGNREELTLMYPIHKEIIEKLTRL